MPVKVPTLQRIAPQAAPTVGRIEARIPDTSKPFEQATTAIAGLGKQFTEQLIKAEKDTAHTEKNRIADEFETWYNEQMNGKIGADGKMQKTGIRHLTGNPAKAYSDLEIASKAKIEELRGSASDYSDVVKTAVSNELFTREGRLYNKSLTTWGFQKTAYEQRVTDNGVKLSQRNAMSSVAGLKVDDPATLAPFRDTLVKMERLRVRHGITMGTASITEDGKFNHIDDDGKQVKVNLNGSVKNEIKKDASEAVRDTVKNLLNIKRTDLAKVMMDEFGDRLEPKTKGELIKLMDEGVIENEAAGIVNKIRTMSLEKQKVELSKTMKKNPELGIKATQMLEAHDGQNSRMAARNSKEAYNELGVLIQTAAQEGTPVDNMIALTKNSKLNSLFTRITDTKQRQAIRESIQRPKGVSNPAALLKIRKELTKTGLIGLDPGELAISLIGLNDEKAKKFSNIWRRNNDPLTLSAEKRIEGTVFEQLEKVALDDGYITKGSRGYSKKNKDLLNALQESVGDEVGETPMSLREIKALSNRLLEAQKAKEDIDNGFVSKFLRGDIRGAFGIGDTPSEPKSTAPKQELTPTPTTNNDPSSFDNLDTNQLGQLGGQFIKESKKPQNYNPSLDELRVFYNKRKGK